MTAIQAIPPSVNIRGALTLAVSAGFRDRPIVITAALRAFSAALANRFAPSIDVLTTKVYQPVWGLDAAQDAVKILSYQTTPLFELMIHSITGKATRCLTREHYLTDAAGQRLPVDIRQIEALLSDLPQIMGGALQHALTAYWSEPAETGISRWQWLSDVLKSALQLQLKPGGSLDSEQLQTLVQVAHCPEKALRSRYYGDNTARTYLIERRTTGSAPANRRLSVEVLVTRQVGQRQVVLQFSPGGAIKAFDALQAFAEAYGRALPDGEVQLQPFEVVGDVFVAQAQALLNDQLENLKSIQTFRGADLADLERRYAQLTDVAAYLLENDAGGQPSGLLGIIGARLPDWLLSAQPAEVLAYSRYLLQLAALQQTTKGKAYDFDVPLLQPFARAALTTAMGAFGASFDPDHLHVTQTRYRADAPGSGTGTSVVETDTLTHRALKNLAGLPHHVTTLLYTGDGPLPAWVTPDSLRALILAADIGTQYPATIKQALLDDPVQRTEREQLFADQLRVQLPMLALEYLIKQQSGLSRAGFGQVVAVMQPDIEARRMDGHVIVMRPLAFKTRASSRRDVVTNMFVIGPQDASVGPHILYRPLYPETLIEFASLASLLEAITRDAPLQQSNGAQAQSLQRSVLDWLDPDARKVYGRGGFDQPHVPIVIIDVDFPDRVPPASAHLDDTPLSGDLLSALYEANARVLTQQADERTLSNAEYRWATLLGLGREVFNALLGAVLPFVRGPAAAVGWLWALETSVFEALDALNDGEGEPALELLFSVLANLGAALLIHRFSNAPPAVTTSLKSAAVTPSPQRVSLDLSAPALSLAAIEDTPLQFSTPIALDSRARLERFIRRFPDAGGPQTTATPLQGIHVVNNRWYARVPARLRGWGWAGVLPASADTVVVLDHYGLPMTGLELKNNGQNLWDLAPEFRLRHGGKVLGTLNTYLWGDPLLNAQRAERESVLKQMKTRRAPLNTEVEYAKDVANDALLDFQAKAVQLRALQAKVDSTQGAELNRLRTSIAVVQQSLRATDQLRLKATARYVDLQLSYVAELEKVRSVLEADPLFLRETHYAFLDECLSRYFMLEGAMEGLSAVQPELGMSREDIFPLAFDRMGARESEGVPYNALLAVRKRMLKSYAQRVEVSPRLEAVAKEWFELDARLYGGQRTKPFQDILKHRWLNTDTLKLFELISLRGALTGNPAAEPSLVEVAGMEGLSRIQIGTVTANLLEFSSTEGFTRNERLLFLKDAIGQYTQAESMARYLERSGSNVSFVPEDFVSKFLARLGEFRAQAEALLADEVRTAGLDDVHMAPPASVRGRRIRKPGRRLIQTSDGVELGDLSEPSDDPDETVVTVDAYTQQRTTWYRHEGEAAIYQKRIVVSPPASGTVSRLVRGFASLQREGRQVLDGIDQLILKVGDVSSRAPEPKGQEDMLLGQARKLDSLAQTLDQMTGQLTPEQKPAAAALHQRLIDASRRLVTEGIYLRIDGARRLPPTVGNLEYLLDKGEVSIGSGHWVDKSSASKGADFLLEFEVLDEKAVQQGRRSVLWYAHFHCQERKASTWKKGHLKLKALRYMTYEDQLRSATTRGIAAVEAANIRGDVAQKLFFRRLPMTEQ